MLPCFAEAEELPYWPAIEPVGTRERAAFADESVVVAVLVPVVLGVDASRVGAVPMGVGLLAGA